jgi:hypothetical protein
LPDWESRHLGSAEIIFLASTIANTKSHMS